MNSLGSCGQHISTEVSPTQAQKHRLQHTLVENRYDATAQQGRGTTTTHSTTSVRVQACDMVIPPIAFALRVCDNVSSAKNLKKPCLCAAEWGATTTLMTRLQKYQCATRVHCCETCSTMTTKQFQSDVHADATLQTRPEPTIWHGAPRELASHSWSRPLCLSEMTKWSLLTRWSKTTTNMADASAHWKPCYRVATCHKNTAPECKVKQITVA